MEIKVIHNCKDCGNKPNVEKEAFVYMICCTNCYDPTPYETDGPLNQAYLIIGDTRESAIDEWNDSFGSDSK